MRRAVRRRVSMLTGLVAMMGVWVVAHQRDIATASAMLTDAQSQEAQVRDLAAKKQAMLDQQARLTANEELLRNLTSPTDLTIVLADLTKRMREPFVITKLFVHAPCVSQYARHADEDRIVPAKRGSDAGAAPSVAPLHQAPSITIHGISRAAQDVITLSALLEASPLFDRVQIVTQTPGEWNGRRAQKFELTCDLVPLQRRHP